MTEVSVIRFNWVQVSAVGAEWELAFAQAVSAFDPSGRFCSTVSKDHETEVFVFAYEAVDHQTAVSHRQLEAAYALHPRAATSRVVLVALARAWPRVREQDVRRMLSDQIGTSAFPRHTLRIFTSQAVSPGFQVIFRTSLVSADAEKEFAAANEAQSPLEQGISTGGIELWNQ